MSDDNYYCRICGLELPSSCLKTIEQLKNENLDSIILHCLHINIDVNNDFPNKACMKCCTIVSNYNSFLNKVQNAQIKLQEIFIQKILSTPDIKTETNIELDVKYVNDTAIYHKITPNEKAGSNLSKKVLFSSDIFQYEFKSELNEHFVDDNVNNHFNSSYEQFGNVKTKDIGQSVEISNSYNKNSHKQNYNNIRGRIDWKCYKCDHSFRTSVLLQEHFQIIHEHNVEYVCTECKALFQNLTEFEVHFNEHDLTQRLKVHKCEVCGKEFRNKTNYKAHQYIHSGEKRFSCDICGKKFSLKQHMEKHKIITCLKNSPSQNTLEENVIKPIDRILKFDKISKSESVNNINGCVKNQKWKCNKCDNYFNASYQLRKHFKIVHKTRIEYKCMICDIIFFNLTKYEKHLNCHGITQNIMEFKCDHCDKRFNHKTNLEAHQYIHEGIKRFSCDECGKKFTLKQHLQGHKITHMRSNITFNCDKCGKKCTNMGAYKNHVRSHLPEEDKYKLKCDICHKKYTKIEALQYHEKQMHEFICDQCGKHFKLKKHLIAHGRTHSNETPYKCDLCPKSFKNNSSLQYHLLTHSGTLAHVCELCGKKFVVKSALTRHQKMHSSERPFGCNFCQKNFRLKRFLEVHLRQHTGERPYSCKECNHDFTDSANYFKHMKVRHGGKQNTSIIQLTNEIESNF